MKAEKPSVSFHLPDADRMARKVFVGNCDVSERVIANGDYVSAALIINARIVKPYESTSAGVDKSAIMPGS